MGSRSTYVRRIEQLELAVVGFGHSVAGRSPAPRAAHHNAVKLAVESLAGSPLAQAADLHRIHAAEDLDFHVRHIDRLLDELGPQAGLQLDLRRVLQALDGALTSYATRDPAPLARLDHAVERILASAEPALQCRIALHMHAIAGAARSAAGHDGIHCPVPVA
jgi:hypothetical protein